eukprot:COSAG05_NODE_26_length_29797_cov_35.911139_7_plen_78_part_00
MGELRTYVWARLCLVAHISDVDVSSEATGVAHVVSNKGGVAVKFIIGSTSLCFYNCHLAGVCMIVNQARIGVVGKSH